MADPNVLLVVLDSVRARNTSLHGHGNRTTPYLETLAEEARTYEQARAPSIHSVSSHASIFTGLHVPEHRVSAHESELDPESTIWHELSTTYGYATGIFSPNVIVTVTSNLADPFETVDGPRSDVRNRLFENAVSPVDVEGHQTNAEYLRRCLESGRPFRSALNGLYFLYGGKTADKRDESAPTYIDSFLEWSDSTDGPWAACLNLMDAHYPYRPKSEFDEWGGPELQAIHDELSTPPSKEIVTKEDWWKLRAVESLYDSCLRQLDTAMERLVSALRARGDLDETLLVVTSDHGEGFGEWSTVNPAVRMADHGWGIHEVLTHVPLIVRPPGGTSGGRETALASLTRFPDVVGGTIRGSDPTFVVDKYALASTYRLEEPTKVLPSSVADRDKYAGPWRAVYEQTNDGVRKHVTQGSKGAHLAIPDAQSSFVLDRTDTGLVQEVYEELTDAGVRVGEQQAESLDENVEEQLEELGYLR
jgi:arylsulfatase A-like enzyme